MGGKQEDEFNLNSSEPARGHISLDQARVLALQCARRIIRQPRSTPDFIGASLAVVLVAIAGAILGGCSALDTQNTTNASVMSLNQQATTVSITPESLTCLVSLDGKVTINLDAETVEAPTQLSYTHISPGEIPALPDRFTATGKAFELTTETPLLKPSP